MVVIERVWEMYKILTNSNFALLPDLFYNYTYVKKIF